MRAAQLHLPGLPVETLGEWISAEQWDEEIMDEPAAHITVMKTEIAEALASGSEGVAAPVFVDCTLGFGGHTEALLESARGARVVAFDRDPIARAYSQKRLARFGGRLTIVAAPFSSLREELAALGLYEVDGVCADLGVSSPQLDDPERGMSFRREGPIDMRMDPSSGETALEMIGRLEDDQLANVIFEFGEERRSRRIARKIKQAYAAGDLRTTLDLRRAIVAAVGPVRVGGVDPATRTFQGLRIAVNQELAELTHLLETLPAVLAPGAHAAILSFHSLEDRLVKRAFKERGTWDALTKKPMTPCDEEELANTRSRSAKLRIARRGEGVPAAEDSQP